jgi:hypothetical protein
MQDEREIVFPGAGTVVDLIPASQAETFLSWAVAAAGKELLVLVPVDSSRRPVSLAPGERIDLVWREPTGLLCLPTVLSAVLPGERPCWRLRAAGVVKRGQRRDAVRAPVTTEIRLGTDSSGVTGVTVDLSEGGLRCVLDAPGLAGGFPAGVRPTGPEKSSVVRTVVVLPEFRIDCLSEVTRRHPRDDGRVELSLRFVGLSEYEADHVRRFVFARLRDLRQRGLL